MKMDSLSKSGLAKNLVARSVENFPACHSHYDRQLQDLPWQGLSVRIRLKARRFRCRNPACARLVFAERLPEVALPHARQTHRLADIVRLIGFVVGGLPGARLLARLAIETSDDTVLRRVKMRQPPDAIEEPICTLGVDDWAWRKGQDYGTILVDLERFPGEFQIESGNQGLGGSW